MTTVDDILTGLEGFAPLSLAESWDNCGLMAGDRTREVTRILCALDVTEHVVAEAIQCGAQVIVAHHPLIFTSLSHITADDTTGRMLRAIIAHDIAVICMHTNADCAQGGVNDALAAVLGLTNIIHMDAGENQMLGRVGNLPAPMEPACFAQYVKKALNAGGVRYVSGSHIIERVAVGGGACGKLMDFAIAKGAQAFVIGDSSYDLMQRAEALGLTLVDAGHFPTENPVTAVFAEKIKALFPELEALCSATHHDCIQFI